MGSIGGAIRFDWRKCLWYFMTQYPGKTPDKDEWVSKFASFCMKNLRRTYLNGARAIMPASVEMEAIRVS